MEHENWNPETSATQRSQIKAYLLEGNSITPLEALRMFGCFRLAAVVFDLKKTGMDIVTRKVKVTDKKYVAEYSLRKDEEQ